MNIGLAQLALKMHVVLKSINGVWHATQLYMHNQLKDEILIDISIIINKGLNVFRLYSVAKD